MLFNGLDDKSSEVEYIYPRVVYVLMERGPDSLSSHPVGITYVETRAIKWVSADKTNRSYIGLQEVII